MGLFSKKTCGHQSASPFRAKCSKAPGHSGRHGTRGMSWAADGKIAFGQGGKNAKGGRR